MCQTRVPTVSDSRDSHKSHTPETHDSYKKNTQETHERLVCTLSRTRNSRKSLCLPKNEVIALWPNTRVVKCKYYVSQKKMGSIIRSTGTVFHSLLYSNSRHGFNGLKYLYSVISVIVNSLPGNTKNRDGQIAISPSLGGCETGVPTVSRTRGPHKSHTHDRHTRDWCAHQCVLSVSQTRDWSKSLRVWDSCARHEFLVCETRESLWETSLCGRQESHSLVHESRHIFAWVMPQIAISRCRLLYTKRCLFWF